MFLESFDVIIADITTEREFRCELDVLSQTIEDGTREVFVKSHVVRSHTDDAVSTAVAEADTEVQFRAGTAVCHHVNSGLRVHVHQANLPAIRVLRVVDESYLPAFRMRLCHIKDTELQTVRLVGIVIGTQLHAVHVAR